MKLASIFFKASANIFEIPLRDTNKRARNMKLASIFFKASANIFEKLWSANKKGSADLHSLVFVELSIT